jgi:hypothetical protein
LSQERIAVAGPTATLADRYARFYAPLSALTFLTLFTEPFRDSNTQHFGTLFHMAAALVAAAHLTRLSARKPEGDA